MNDFFSFIIIWAIFIAGIIFLIYKKWIYLFRGYIQLSSFVISEVCFFNNKSQPCLNCPLSFGICPIGTIQRASFLNNIQFYLTIIIFIFTGVVLGTLTCGWACPVGFFQDIINSVKIRNFKISNKFSLIRYFILTVYISLIFLEIKYKFLTYKGIGVFNIFTVGAGSLIILLALFIKRPFCRFLCPIGSIYWKLNILSPLKVQLNKEHCLKCRKCINVCISDINPIKDVNNDHCVKCFNCVKVCKIK